ncbi:MAG: hypothetical protein J0L73_19625 [Verrucomicrobia bacterium]|nr:hypothetical protein [Verrucomicrobiota bacterium]
MKFGRASKTVLWCAAIGATAMFFAAAVSFSVSTRHNRAQQELSQYCSAERIDMAKAKIEQTGVENSLFQSIFDFSIEDNQMHSIRFYIDFVGNVEPHRLVEPKMTP